MLRRCRDVSLGDQNVSKCDSHNIIPLYRESCVCTIWVVCF